MNFNYIVKLVKFSILLEDYFIDFILFTPFEI